MPGLLLIALGGGTNAAVIALNGGTLPANADALVEAGFSPDPAEYKNSGVVDDPVLAWLGDIMATPSWLPFRNVISLGDIVVLVGGLVLLHVVCDSRVGRMLRRAALESLLAGRPWRARGPVEDEAQRRVTSSTVARPTGCGRRGRATRAAPGSHPIG